MLAGLFLIDRYVFSLVGAVLKVTLICAEKSVTVGVDNAGAQKLSFPIDPMAIQGEMRKNPLYKVGGANVRISRRFGEVEYGVQLQTLDGTGYFNIDTFDTESYAKKQEGVYGEGCTTPNHVLTDNIKSIIDDLPLTESQKDEMKSYVQSRMVSHVQIFSIM